MRTFCKSFVVLSTLVLSSMAHAGFTDMKPGLWQVETVMVVNGQEVNLGGLLGSAMKNMPEDIKEKAKNVGGVALNEKGILLCMTADMIKKPETLAEQNKEKIDCKVKISKQTKVKIEGTVDCPDKKTSAKLEYNYVNPTEYRGKIDVLVEGKKMSSNYTGKFLKADCGEVQPTTK